MLFAVGGLPPLASAAWIQEVVDNSRDVGFASQIGFHGDFHVVYFDNTNHVLKYAHQASGTPWTVENIGPGGHASLALDANGAPHIAFTVQSAGGTAVAHAVRTGPGQWATVTVDQGPSISDTSIAIGPNGAIHVAYRFGSQLKYAVNSPGTP
ncbi:MAG TPA: hypothetical protein VFG38_08860, partial [Pseudomonadales bacterium]|nr:hypothetical protein [Pseudomonadales bacterium]